jgi:nicotinamide-nucleotide amidase
MNHNDKVIELLRQRGETVSVAESLTGGSLSKALTDIEGASHVFLGGVIAYSVASKLHDLDVPQNVIDSAGVYSKETALAMADGAKRRFGSDWAIATTGVAGPGESHGVAAGNLWIAIVGAQVREVEHLALTGSRSEVRSGAVASALSAFARILA